MTIFFYIYLPLTTIQLSNLTLLNCMRAVCQLELNNKKRMLRHPFFIGRGEPLPHEQKQASVMVKSHLRCLSTMLGSELPSQCFRTLQARKMILKLSFQYHKKMR